MAATAVNGAANKSKVTGATSSRLIAQWCMSQIEFKGLEFFHRWSQSVDPSLENSRG